MTEKAMTQEQVEQMVIETGNPMKVYGVEELTFSKENPYEIVEDPNNFAFYEDGIKAGEAFHKLAEEGKDCILVISRFYLNENGYIQNELIDQVEEFQFGQGFRTLIKEVPNPKQ